MKDITEQLMFKAPPGHVLHGCSRPARWLRWSHVARARWLVEAGYARDLLDAVGVLEGCGEWPVENLNPNHKPEDYWWNK